MLVGFSPAVTLETPFNVNVTLALNPRMLEVLMVDVHEEPLPATTATKKGFAVISKSGCLTFTETNVEPWTVPLVPVISIT
jgi:hypothetical protein